VVRGDEMTKDDLPLNELTRLKVDHARLGEAYKALRQKYDEAFPGPRPKPGQRKATESYDVAFFPYPPEWDALQEWIAKGDAVVGAARKALHLLDMPGAVSTVEARRILRAALEGHNR